MISVIIPVYNAERTLQRCVDSLLAQTFKDYEIILVNDGSRDHSLDVCKSYADCHDNIKIIDQKNAGVSAARNAGIVYAQGEFITFIDSDDYVRPSYLEDFNSTKLTADIYVQGIDYIFPHNNRTKHFFTYSEDMFNLVEHTDKIIPSGILENGCPVAKLFKKSIIEDNNLRFNQRLSINEDHLFVTQYYTHCNTVYLSDKVNYLYVYDITTESLTKRKRTSSEWMAVGAAMNEAFNTFTARFAKEFYFWCPVFPIFGLNQLLKASIAAYSEPNSKAPLAEINRQWKKYTGNRTIIIDQGFFSKKMSKWLSTDVMSKYYAGKFLLITRNVATNLKHRLRAIIYR